MAATKIVLPKTYDTDGLPVESGVMDPRLGVLEPRYLCRTCGGSIEKCPGHFGYIELAKPVINVLFAREIANILKATCKECHKVKIPKEEREKYLKLLQTTKNQNKRDEIIKEIKSKAVSKTQKCPNCGAKQNKIKFIPPYHYREITPQGPINLTASDVRERLEEIPDEDAYLLGFDIENNRPEWMVLTDLPVPPLPVRPSIVLEKGGRAEDDLTHKLVDIVRVNNNLRESIDSGTPQHIIDDLWNLLQYHVATYFDNNLSGVPSAKHRTKRPIKGIAQRLEGKEGRFRSNLAAKRVDFSARTVISPDPLLDINEVGVPFEIAKTLTIPVTVSELNIEEAKTLVALGPKNHPGAKYVERTDGTKVDLRFISDLAAFAENISPGYKIGRYLMDGDVVLFNRQPSLHRISMMGHRVKVLPYKTFRLNLAVCPPYNADFDGDEMNLHALQTLDSRVEAEELMLVEKNIISPRFGGALVGGILDHITGSYLLTRRDTLLSKKELGLLLSSLVDYDEIPEPAILEPKEYWTGKQVFSLLLPKDLNFKLKASVYIPKTETGKEGEEFIEDTVVIVKNGELLTGVIDTAAIGAIVESGLTLLDVIANKYGGERAREFLNKYTKVTLRFLSGRGFTLGLDEEDLPPEIKEKVKEIILEGYREIEKLLELFNKGEFQPLPGRTKEETLEIKVGGILSNCREKIGKEVSKSLDVDNSIVVMTSTKAKGSAINIGQMAGSVGQQSLRGRRISEGYIRRALPHFKKGEKRAKSRGFVESSYKRGLTPTELYFHAMAGRESLVDKAIRTADSGYLQRRLMNAFQDLRIENDGTVRDSEGKIISFLYGDDGVDVTKTYHGEPVLFNELEETIANDENKVKKGMSNKNKQKLVEKELKDLPERIRNETLKIVTKHKINKETLTKILKTVKNSYLHALVDPFEPIGVVTAQSIGEPSTQLTLRTFHFAGVAEKNITLGFPRLKEVLDMRKKPSTPSMTIYLDEEHRKSRDKALKIAEKIRSLTLKDIIEKIEIEPLSREMVLTLKEELINQKGIDLKKVKSMISKKMKGEVKEERNSLIVQSGIDSYRKFKEAYTKLLDTTVYGVKGITKTLIKEKAGEYVIETEGSNLKVVLKMEGVDRNRTTTNDILEIYNELGIEAARAAIINEIKSVLENQGIKINIRHILLAADTLTFTGDLKQVGRYGVTGEKGSFLARASYEITVKTLAEAAIKGEEDELPGVVERVIAGVPIQVGTGAVELYAAF